MSTIAYTELLLDTSPKPGPAPIKSLNIVSVHFEKAFRFNSEQKAV